MVWTTKTARWIVATLAVTALAACVSLGSEDETEENVGMASSSLLGAVTASFQNGVSPSSSYAGARDTYIAQATPTTANGSATTLLMDGDNGGGVDLATLLAWDISSIPAGSTVREVTITFNVTNPSAGNYEIYDLKRSWTESQATWNVAATGTSWGAPGATSTSDRGTTVLGTVAARANGTYTVTLNASGVAVVQSWVNDPTQNRGFIIANTSTADGVDVSSREVATTTQRPKLSIGYDPPATDAGTDTGTDTGTDSGTSVTTSFQNGALPSSAYAGTRDTYLAQATPTTANGSATTLLIDGDNGSGVDLSALVAWDVSSIPAGSPVTAASITINVTNPSAGDYQIYELKRAWSEAQATWNVASSGVSWGAAGATSTTDRGTTVLGTVSARANGTYTVALNSAGIAVVQGWVNDPTTNNGFIVANTTTADGVDFSSREAATIAQRPKLTVTYGGSAPPPPPPSTIPTDANLKVAFIGDTATGSNFQSVLSLIRSEGADMVMIQGDLTYSGATAAQWFSVIDNQINASWPGSTATVTIPYFVAKGNHDSDWASLGAGLRDRMANWGVASENGDPTTQNYSVVYRGLKMVMVTDSETSPTRADYVNQRLSGDTHLWKVCSWHKNQRATNVGPKTDEMGWEVYENCRMQGAIVAQGHSHTYSRSKTITSDATQTVDGTCSDPFNLCISPGRHVFLDSSLGGVDMRTLDATWSVKPYWASTYTGAFGALFVEFNVDGDARKARGYFKTVGGTIVDPPASSGLTSFVMNRTD